mgnify:CR=1 FL=1
MILPNSPNAYDQSVESQRNLQLEQADDMNRKKNQDIELRNDRLILQSGPNMSEQALEKQASDTVGPYRELLESALERSGGTHTYEDVLDAIILGDMFFWPAEKSCMVTEIVQYPRLRALHVFLAAGDLDEIRGMESSLISFAKSIKCSALSMSGRKGWAKALKEMEWHEAHTTLVKQI